jgi:two-component system response regulator HydG
MKHNRQEYPERHSRGRDSDFPLVEAARSGVMTEVLAVAARVARFDSSVLITGETGTGKEVLARHIHGLSLRAAHPLLAINCSALPETLLESELFGHKAGSFTGAIHDRVGLFEQAARGTILLDEIGDISPVIQLKLIRVLQEREILRIGENIPRKVDARIIAATNRSLEKGVEAGTFREDLLYRLRVIEIAMPALRERGEDIVPLSRCILAGVSAKLDLPGVTLDAACLDLFRSYTWPGNVREMQNVIERGAILSDGGLIELKHLPAYMTDPGAAAAGRGARALPTLAEKEMEYIREVLKMTNGNRTRAARILGIGQATLWRRLKNAPTESDS